MCPCSRLLQQSNHESPPAYVYFLELDFRTRNLMPSTVETGLNPYDVRKKWYVQSPFISLCPQAYLFASDRDRSKDGPLCYKEMTWIETFLNDPSVKKTLGVPSQVDFESCNMGVGEAFHGQGDGMKNSAVLLGPLIDDGIRLLVYAGNADAMCNYMVRLSFFILFSISN